MKRIPILGVGVIVAILLAGPATAASNDTYKIHGTVLTTAVIDPALPAIQIDGVGVVSRLGRVQATSTQTVSGNPLAPAVGDVIQSTDLVLRAANGDTLIGTYEAVITEVDLPRIAFDGTVSFSGGTGRFTGASGSVDTTGGFSFVDLRGFYTLDGDVTLPKG